MVNMFYGKHGRYVQTARRTNNGRLIRPKNHQISLHIII